MRGGARYLNELLRRFGNDLRLGLAACNAGEDAVMRYGRKVPPYPETQQYVSRVLGRYEALADCAERPRSPLRRLQSF